MVQDVMRLKGPSGARIDFKFHDVTRQDAMDEALYRLTSVAGKGIEFHGCPECGAFGHGMKKHWDQTAIDQTVAMLDRFNEEAR